MKFNEPYVYNDFPIGEIMTAFVANFFMNKISQSEKSIFSLKTFGFKINFLNRISIAFIYRYDIEQMLY